MPGKKDPKKDAKKGGKPEPEKKKEEEKKGKDDKKPSKDDKKGGKDDKKGVKDDKKGGKDDKKGGKDDRKGGKVGKDDMKGGKRGKADPTKGKDDGKKGKGRKIESDEEEEELLSDEEEEEEFSDEEDEEEESEDDRRGKRGGGKGAKEKKGRKSRHMEDSEEEEEDEEDEEEEDDDEEEKRKAGRHHKGEKSETDAKKKKAKKKEEAPVIPVKELPKRGLKNMSRMFMKFSGFKKRRNSRKKLKSTSRLFLGLGKRRKHLARKKRRKSILKNTSRFMMRFKVSKKRKKEKEAKEKAAANSGNKPTYMLLRLGGVKETSEKKGGFFKGLFGRKDGKLSTNDFKSKSLLLGKAAAATNWLTRRFLSTKMRGNAGFGGSRRLSRQASSRHNLRGYNNNGYDHEEGVFGYDQQYLVDQTGYRGHHDGYGAYEHEANVAYGNQGQFGYYENDVGGLGYQDQEYYEAEGLYDPNAEYYEGGLYNEGIEDYYNPHQIANGYYRNQQEADYGYRQQQAMEIYGDEGLDYYAQMGDEHIYGEEVNGLLDPYAEGYYDNNQGVYYDHGHAAFYENHYGEHMGMQEGLPPDYQLIYSDGAMPYQDYIPQQVTSFPTGGQQVYGFVGQGMDHIQGLYEDQNVAQLEQYRDNTNVIQGGEMAFRVPRPQVRLFGKERLDVTLPPPPTLPPDPEFEDMSEIQYEDQIPLVPDQSQQMLADQMMQQQQQGFGPVSVPTPTAMIIKQANNASSLCHKFSSSFSSTSTETQPITTTIYEKNLPKTSFCYFKTDLISFLPCSLPLSSSQNAASKVTFSYSRNLTSSFSSCIRDTKKFPKLTKSFNETALSTLLTPCIHEEAKSSPLCQFHPKSIWREKNKCSKFLTPLSWSYISPPLSTAQQKTISLSLPISSQYVPNRHSSFPIISYTLSTFNKIAQGTHTTSQA
ncbi:hypothetical protein D4764_06G0004180 [Takifugu flavidus]|uniref:Unconventional myosin-XV n=1 Tax=Takifugu flavidus TaxID=433684 RepID=A0A5C6MX33_9TELE|nr:hypothetical protein D4764_06G0004180 [Takifugu flavidus]